MLTGSYFTDECPICGIYKFRTHDHKKQHAHFVLCSAVEDIYKRCVLAPNRGKVRGNERTIIDVEVARIDVELGICSAAWVNPYYVIDEDKKYLNPPINVKEGTQQ